MRKWAWAALAVRAHLLIRRTDMSDIATLQNQILTAIDAADTPDALEAVRIDALGKQGSVSALLKTLGQMSPEERQVQGPMINGLREAVTNGIAAKKAALETAILNQRLATERLDMTLPAPEAPRGTVHPVSQVMDELAEIFADMGFAVAEGPEIEDDWHNFSALNIPETHPARAMHDTFYFPDQMAQKDENGDGKKMLLRTHTSPVQIRTMTSQEPPIRIIAPGRVYRSDSDATHTPMLATGMGKTLSSARSLPVGALWRTRTVTGDLSVVFKTTSYMAVTVCPAPTSPASTLSLRKSLSAMSRFS